MNSKYPFLRKVELSLFAFLSILIVLIFIPAKYSNLVSKNIQLIIGFSIIGLALIALVIATLWLVYSLISSGLSYLHRCPVCGSWAKDTLFDGDKNKETHYCRQHLIENYKKEFLKTHYHAVITEFDPEILVTFNKYSGFSKNPVGLYKYFPLSELNQLPKSNLNTKEILQNLLIGISNKRCEGCGGKAQILFIPKELGKGDLPEKLYSAKGNYYCREDAAEKIIPALRIAPFNFHAYHGLYLPYKEDGFQTTIFA